MTLFDELNIGLNQAIDGLKGKGELRINTVKIIPLKHYSSKEIKDIRLKTKMSQSVFAGFLGVSNKTIEAWEAGTKKPSGTASRLLNLIEIDDDFINKYPFVM